MGDLSVFTELETPDVDGADALDYQARLTEMGIPLQPQLHHKDGQSHVGASIFDGSVALSAAQLADDGGVILNVKEEKWNKVIGELRSAKRKCNQLEIENKFAVDSKMRLLQSTSMEIEKLKQIINAMLNLNMNNRNVIHKMLTSLP